MEVQEAEAAVLAAAPAEADSPAVVPAAVASAVADNPIQTTNPSAFADGFVLSYLILSRRSMRL